MPQKIVSFFVLVLSFGTLTTTMLARHIPRVTSRAVRRPLSSASAVQVEPSFIEAERPSVNVHQV